MSRTNRKGIGLIAICLAVLVMGLLACGSSATAVEAPEVAAPMASNIDGQTVPPGWTPMGTVAGVDRSARLLEALGKLPLSFKEEGVWFNDYAQAFESAMAPRPATWSEYLALSEDERDAYQTATQGLAMGPGLFASIRDNVTEWEERLGFSQFAVSVAISTGEVNPGFPPNEAAYMLLQYDHERFRQGLLDLGYVEDSANGVTYYDAPRPTLGSGGSDPLSFIASNSMRRVVLGEGTLAIGGVRMIDLLPSIPGVALGEAPSLNDDAAFHSLALSLAGPLFAVLMTRSTVLEPEVVNAPRYEKPADWGNLGQWEALGMGYGISEDIPWMALSLFYPDPDAAKADAEELTLRMSDYDSAISLTHPGLREEQLSAMLKRPIDAICGTLAADYTSDENGSTLTMRCNIAGESSRNVWWSVLLGMRDLGFLLP